MLGSRAYEPDDIKGISPDLQALDADDSDNEPLDNDFADSPPTASSADVLRDWQEQNLFR